MARVLLLLCLLAGAYWLLTQTGGPQVQTDGSSVRLATQDLDVEFQRLEPISQSYMLFGGNNEQPRNSFTHATVAALALEDARLIAHDHPDFHLCRSPGAARAKERIATVSLLGATRRARRAVTKAVDLHRDRLASGGDRTCLTLAGARMALASARVREGGQDLTPKLGPALGRTELVLAETASIADCAALLRSPH
jgi:hypothetical protein